MIQSSQFFSEEHQQLFIQRLHDFDQTKLYNVVIQRGHKIKVKKISVDAYHLIYSKNKIIDLRNVYLKFSKGNMVLSRNCHYIEMGGEGIFEIYNIIKKYAIQINFSQCFSLLNQLGEGKQGIVHGIKRNLDGQVFACKSIKKNQYSTDLEIRAIKLEIKILRELDHPNLIQLLETYEDHSSIHLIFEQLDGGQLQQDITQEQQALRIFKPIFKALSYLHSKSIFHRDIKFSNIIFKRKDDWDSACLIDFGLADYWQQKLPDYIFYRCGTPGFVAPEILQDHHYLLNVDVYSLGLCLYKLLTGNMAFFGSCEDEVILKNYYGKIDFYKLNVSPNCLDLMKKILTLDYKKRISANNVLKHPIYQDEQQPFRIVRTKKLEKLKNHQSLCLLQNSTDSSPISPQPSLNFNKKINAHRFQLRKLY